MSRMKKVSWTLLALLFALLVVRTFFLGVYYVDSPSMEPTLHGAEEGGDFALVAYGDASDLKRYDIVVVLREGEAVPLVKRVVGLPGETVLLRGGNVWIDGEIVRPDPPLPVPITIFDEESGDLERAFRMAPAWSKSPEGWLVDASQIPRGSDSGLIFMRLGLKDHYMDPNGKLVPGEDSVADALLEFTVQVDEPGIVLRMGLIEQGDRFEATLDTAAKPLPLLTLERRSPSGREVLSEQGVTFIPGRHELRFGNLDDRILFVIDGETQASVTYTGNEFWALDQAKVGTSPPTDRVFLGGVAGQAVVSGIRVLRDLHYSPRGKYAIDEALDLGPYEIFVLGDNSRDSQDGRDWGGLPLRTVVGRPLGVVWPWKHMRSIPRPGDREKPR